MATGGTIRVSLVLRDFTHSPEELSRRLGVTADVTSVRGDQILDRRGRRTGRVHRHSSWSLESKLPPSEPLNSQVAHLLDLPASFVEAWLALPMQPVREIYCTIIPDGQMPYLRLEAATLAKVATLRCDVVVDVIEVEAMTPEE